MKRFFQLSVVFAFLVLIAAVSFTPISIKPAKPAKRDSIVRLVSETGGTFCSGVVIDDNTVITAAHCVIMQPLPFLPPMVRTGITLRNDDNIDLKTPVLTIRAWPQMDTAVLTGDFREFQHADYSGDVSYLLSVAHTGQKFKACGFPLGGKLYCSDLVFKGIRIFAWGAKGVLIPGMSGGPVFVCDYLGKCTVVAVNTAMNEDEAIVSPIYNIRGME